MSSKTYTKSGRWERLMKFATLMGHTTLLLSCMIQSGTVSTIFLYILGYIMPSSRVMEKLSYGLSILICLANCWTRTCHPLFMYDVLKLLFLSYLCGILVTSQLLLYSKQAYFGFCIWIPSKGMLKSRKAISVIGIMLNHMVRSILAILPAEVEENKFLHKHIDCNVISSRSCLLTI